MVPEIYCLRMHLGQVASEVNALVEKRNNDAFVYKRINIFIDSLNELVEKIKEKDFSLMKDPDKKMTKVLLTYLSNCCLYLKSSAKEGLPPSIYSCLRQALCDWIGSSKDYIMACHKGGVSEFYYALFFEDNQIRKYIVDEYNVTFTHSLIPFAHPSFLEKDFFCNNTLYHELGHFVDQKLKITEKILLLFICQEKIPQETVYFKKINVSSLFPYDEKNPVCTKEAYVLYSYLKEYFADVFAAQYIANSNLHFLNYLAGDCEDSDDHPASQSRIKLVQEFLGDPNAYGEFLKSLCNLTEKITSHKLERRYVDVDSSSFNRKEKTVISGDNELHTMFINAWKYLVESGCNAEGDPVKSYLVINDLINESIREYVDSKPS